MKRSAVLIILAGLLCCAAMALVDGLWQPAYALKSGIKVVLFLLIPLGLSLLQKDVAFRELFRFRKKGFAIALGLGIGIYGVILGAYLLVRNWFDFSGIAKSLSQNAGVTKDNFLFVSLYISFANSLLEEFFFRGFLFTNLKRLRSRSFAYGFSALLFSVYHVAMMIGWFSPVLFILVMVGLMAGGMIFNWLNERLDTIYCSWLTHMFANFAINTIGFMLMA